MADLNFQKVDLSSIKAIAHDGSYLQVLLATANGYSIESLSAPEQAFQRQQQACSFCFPYPSTRNSAIALTGLLDKIRIITVLRQYCCCLLASPKLRKQPHTLLIDNTIVILADPRS